MKITHFSQITYAELEYYKVLETIAQKYGIFELITLVLAALRILIRTSVTKCLD